MLISFIIPAYNEEKYIEQTLSRLQNALSEHKGKGYSWEIIVCDNNSTDKTAEVASNMGAKLTFEPVNQISRARNSGAKIASGEWLIFLDADSYPVPALMAEVLALIKADKHIGCGTTILVEGGTLFNKLRMERLNPLFRLFNLCGGVFIACKSKAFQEINGFSLDLYAYEEFDFVFRLKRFGKSQGKKFTILHQHPVRTSGRKGEFKASSLFVLIASNVAAIFLFILYYILPGSIFKKINAKFLTYWYSNRK